MLKILDSKYLDLVMAITTFIYCIALVVCYMKFGIPTMN